MTEQPGLFDTIYNCRAMRRLKTDPVPEEEILQLIEAANQAPTGSNPVSYTHLTLPTI